MSSSTSPFQSPSPAEHRELHLGPRQRLLLPHTEMYITSPSLYCNNVVSHLRGDLRGRWKGSDILKRRRERQRALALLLPLTSSSASSRLAMDDLDHGLLALVAAFHRADLEKLHDTETGNGRPGARSHEQAAFDLYEREIVTLEQLFSDRRLALSLDTAVRQDGPIVAELAEVERGAAEDRALALEVARGRSISSAGSNSSNSRSSSVSSTRSSVADSTVSFIRTSREASTSASSYGSPSPVPFRHKTPLKPLKQVQRTICSDHVREDRSVTVPCAHLHRYCNTCAKDLFLLASRDESLFPPRCDGAQIPLTLVQHLLTPHERTLFKRKATEFGTANRLYCSNAPCSEFLGAASDTKKSVRCDSCAQQTCEACKAPWHGLFGACAKGADAEVANALAKDYGYQSCPGCHRLVELSVGCFHMYVNWPSRLLRSFG